MPARRVHDATSPPMRPPPGSAGTAPRVLLVDTSLAGGTPPGAWWDEVIDYGALSPRWTRGIERSLRTDVSLARLAVSRAHGCDVVLAGSEKVGIPLAVLGSPRPVFCVVHQIASPLKRAVMTAFDVPARWARVGYQCSADRDLLMAWHGVPADRLVQVNAADLDAFRAPSEGPGEYVLSLGTSKRDYGTLVAALRGVEDVAVHLYVSSRFLDPYRGRRLEITASNIDVRPPVERAQLPAIYAGARIVVVPIERTWQYSAGMTSALEALAAARPVVATDTPGMRDVVIDGVTGFRVPLGDARAMREAVLALWRDPARAAAMGQAGRALAERAFHPARVDAACRRACAEIHEEANGVDSRLVSEWPPRADVADRSARPSPSPAFTQSDERPERGPDLVPRA